MRVSLQPSITKTANFTSSALRFNPQRIRKYKEILLTWDATALDRASGDETYDLYVTCSDGISEWDLVHFPQIASSGAKRFTAKISSRLLPENVTTASPGVAANDSATLATVSGGANAVKSLAAGSVRHGPFGHIFTLYLVIGGSTPTITYSVLAEFRN